MIWMEVSVSVWIVSFLESPFDFLGLLEAFSGLIDPIVNFYNLEIVQKRYLQLLLLFVESFARSNQIRHRSSPLVFPQHVRG